MAEEQTQQRSNLGQREGGLPRWAWIGLAAAVGVVGLVWYQSRKASQTASQTPTDTTAQGLDTGQYETLLAQLRDLQGNQSQPLPAPAQTPTGDSTFNVAKTPTPANPSPIQNWVDTTGPGPYRTLRGIATFRGRNTAQGLQQLYNANTGVLSGIANPYDAALPNGLKITVPWLDSNGNTIN